ncbi:hypothetical protein [Mastigocladopsis repens]|uniref:hypothetical protein n=1 Tax=Mastigocladopsis repens TaxID=221287 RepID=UPI00037F060B|nr:hypothetical protein [Mastigocladopsis repens]
MKLKLMMMLSSVIGLAFVAVPLGVQALPSAPNQVLQAQRFPQQGAPGQRPNINLSDDQKERLEEINKETREKIDDVLTSEQRQELEEKTAAMRNRRGGTQGGFGGPGAPTQAGGGNDPFAQLNLSDDQKEKIQEIVQSSQEEVKSVLTDEQREQIEQSQQNMPKRPQ